MTKLFLFLIGALLSVTVINATSSEHLEEDYFACVTVHTSCGITGSACGNTTADIIEAVQDLEDWMCGPGAPAR